MKFAVIKILAIVSAICIFTGCQPASAPKIGTQVDTNRARVKMPPRPVGVDGQIMTPEQEIQNLQRFGWQLDAGDKQKIADMKGKVVLLDFWATYCGPCIQAIPHLIELQNKYKDKGLVVVGLNVGGEEDRPLVPAFVKRLNIDYALGTPEEELTALLFKGTTNIPQTFIFDREGKPVKSFMGYDAQIKVELDQALEQVMAN